MALLKPLISDGELGKRVTDKLRDLILSGELPPGSPIRQAAMGERFNASRIPVREALLQLESEGLVMLSPNRGGRVAELDLTVCLETYRIRERLEPLALEESVRHMTEAELDVLDGLAVETERTRDRDEFLRLDRAFHLASYCAAGMPQLIGLVERYWNTTQHFRRAHINIIWSDGLWETYYEHRLLVAAARRRDSAGAGRILCDHIRRSRMKLEQHPEIFGGAMADLT